MKNKRKIKLTKFILFFSGIIMGMALIRTYTYIVGICPSGTTGVVVMIFLSILYFYCIIYPNDNNDLKEEIYNR